MLQSRKNTLQSIEKGKKYPARKGFKKKKNRLTRNYPPPLYQKLNGRPLKAVQTLQVLWLLLTISQYKRV